MKLAISLIIISILLLNIYVLREIKSFAYQEDVKALYLICQKNSWSKSKKIIEAYGLKNTDFREYLLIQ